jgi:PucR family transcriptional regulator, purine catabolism regulatory protein
LVTCRSILKLYHLQKMKLVAGEGGLNRIITWVHVVELTEVTKWVKGGELLFITGVTIKDNVEALLKLVNDINKRNLSGLVINVGPYIKKTPKEVIELANSIDFPIFEIPFEVKLIDIAQGICKEIFTSKLRFESVNNFMKELIYGDIEVTDEIENRATLYGYSAKKCYCSLVVDINNFSGYIKKNNIKDEETILDIKTHIEQIIEHLMYMYSKKHLYMKHSNSFLVIVPVDKMDKELNDIKLIAEDIKRDIEEKINGLEVSIGIGGISSELKEFKKIYYEHKNLWKYLKNVELKVV